MKQAKQAKKKPEPQAKVKPRPNINLGRNNYIILMVGIIVIIVGFIALARGSITLAPILLVIGYCVLVPLAILLKKGVPKTPKKQETVPPKTQNE
ncbi:MAG: hypothetical protein OEZ20_03495 [candidate division WOR-3 bacterium]|nr:hypothetical protein [candidate division WOR-3 bacterium]MDH5683511.1 hypothetical protein [candidate division WOR-3 bacterium]